MPPRPLRDLLPLVLPHVPGCPDMAATLNLRLSAIDFCERTRCWRHLTEINVSPGDSIAAVPDYATVHEIEHADFTHNGCCDPLTPIAYTDASDHRWRHASGRAGYITQVSPGSLMVLPDAAGMLSVSMFLKPRNDQDFTRAYDDSGIANYYDQVPDFMIQQYGEALAAGALARLMIQPGTAWINPATAVFWAGLAREKMESMSSGSLQGQQMAPVRSKTLWM